jgi:hypothetical protein
VSPFDFPLRLSDAGIKYGVPLIPNHSFIKVKEVLIPSNPS